MVGWPDVMAIGSDATSIDHAPERGASGSMVAYFVVWVGIGSLLLPNLFVVRCAFAIHVRHFSDRPCFSCLSPAIVAALAPPLPVYNAWDVQ